MSIQQDINTFLERTGWSAYRLAKASGVNLNIIRRIQRGIRAGMNTRTLDRLAPFIYTSPPDSKRRRTALADALPTLGVVIVALITLPTH